MTDTRRPADNDVASGPAFTLTRVELEALVARAVRIALEATPAASLVDKQDMARQLGCSPRHLDHLRKRGLPAVPVGHVVRFEPAKVIAWLKAQEVPA